MASDVELVQVWRGEILESIHRGHAVICDASGQIVQAWGDPDAIIYPRSSCKMVQALPLVETGLDLTSEQMALACASHQGAAIHTDRVTQWLTQLGLTEADMRCGPQTPDDRPAREALVRAGDRPCQIHNNCSGKHAGFLMLNQHIGGEAEYVEPDHPVQLMMRQTMDEVAQETSPGYGIDGCSAPNFATSMHGLARAMASFASAGARSDARSQAQSRLVSAMMQHPDLVAGEKRACTELMRAMNGQAVVKTGAEAVFVGIVPGQNLGIAVKISDGGTRGAEAVIASLMAGIGVLDPAHPMAQKRLVGPMRNRRGTHVGVMRVSDALQNWSI